MSAESTAEQVSSQLATAPKAAMNFMPTSLEGVIRLSELFAKSGLLPDSLKKKPEDVLYILMAGAEFGIPPTVALREMYVVNGRPGFSSLLKVGMVKNDSRCAYFKLIKSTPEVAIFETKRKDEGVTRLEYTYEQAKAAGYTAKAGEWQKNPALMLRRRVTSQLCDEVYPDVTRGAISTDLGDEFDATTAPVVTWAERVSSTPTKRPPVDDDFGLGDPQGTPPQQPAAGAPSVESTQAAPSNGKPAASGRDAELDLQLEAAFAMAKSKADMKNNVAPLANEVEEEELKKYWRARYNVRIKEFES